MIKQNSYTSLGKRTALITFIIATSICLLFIFTGNMRFGFWGYLFFLGAFVVNLITLIFLLIKAKKSEHPIYIYRGISLMLLNIPVAVFYFAIGIYFTGIMRIRIENNTGSDIMDVTITGCEQKKIDFIKDGEFENVWINIPNDCGIQLYYQDAQGEPRSETMVGYASSGMGQKITHQIGKDRKR